MKGYYHSKKRDAVMKRHHFAILRAAMDVFSEKGYHAATLDSIAAHANLSKGSIYTHFQSKRDLFLSVIKWGEYQLIYHIRETRRRCTDARDIIGSNLRAYFKFFEKKESFFKVLVLEKYNFHDDAINIKFVKLYGENIKDLESDIRKGIDDGIIRDINPHSCALMLNSIASGLFFDWMYSDSNVKIVDLFNDARDFIKYGMYTMDTTTKY